MPILNQLPFYNWFNITDFMDGPELPPNNQTSLWNMRDRLFLTLFERIAAAYSRTLSAGSRKFIEHLFLLFAVSPLFVLIYIHINFIQTPANCLSEVKNIWPRDGILRVELGFQVPRRRTYGTCYYEGISLLRSVPSRRDTETTPEEPPINLLNKTYIHYTIQPGDFLRKPPIRRNLLSKFATTPLPPENLQATFDYYSNLKNPMDRINEYDYIEWPLQDYVIEYTLEYGYLKLSTDARHRLRIPILVVVLDPTDKQCFGNPFSLFLLKHVVGYSDVLMSSLKNLVDKDRDKGFVRNIITGDQYRFVNKSLTWTSYGIAAITMIAFTLSISMLLRYSHNQIFMFIVQLLNVLEFNLNVSFPAASLLTVVFALVGMEAIMSEFFNDSTTAFYVILIVWIGDQYDSICSHNIVTKRHWLRFFFLYHFGFYAYDHRFNGQYSSLALFTSWMFIQHSMVYFFHHFELPTLPLVDNEALMPQNYDWSFDLEPNGSFEDSETSSNSVTSNSAPESDASPSQEQEITLS